MSTSHQARALAELVAIQDLKHSHAQAAAHAEKFRSDENYRVVDELATELAQRQGPAWEAARAALAQTAAHAEPNGLMSATGRVRSTALHLFSALKTLSDVATEVKSSLDAVPPNDRPACRNSVRLTWSLSTAKMAMDKLLEIAPPAALNREPLHVGDSAFECWLWTNKPNQSDGEQGRYTKQDMRDCYAAGLNELRAHTEAEVHEELKREILSINRNFAAKEPEKEGLGSNGEDETWASWYSAAFDLMYSEIESAFATTKPPSRANALARPEGSRIVTMCRLGMAHLEGTSAGEAFDHQVQRLADHYGETEPGPTLRNLFALRERATGKTPTRLVPSATSQELACLTNVGQHLAHAGGPPHWRCFHCDAGFEDVAAAREHFGPTEYHEPGCQIDLKKYRAMEENNRRHCEEDTDLHRAIIAAQNQGRPDAKRAEEEGYARGLADAKKHPEELGLQIKVPAPRFVWVCGNGCGNCDVKRIEFEYWRTETLAGARRLVESKTIPRLVSRCCGASLTLWDNERDEQVDAEVDRVEPSRDTAEQQP